MNCTVVFVDSRISLKLDMRGLFLKSQMLAFEDIPI